MAIALLSAVSACSKPIEVSAQAVELRRNHVGCLVTAKVTNRGQKFASEIRLNAMINDRAGDNLGYASDVHELAGLESREFELSFSGIDCSEIKGIAFASPNAAVWPRDDVLPAYDLEGLEPESD